MMKDDDFKLLRGFGDGRTNERTDICDCRVAFATENASHLEHLNIGDRDEYPGCCVKLVISNIVL